MMSENERINERYAPYRHKSIPIVSCVADTIRNVSDATEIKQRAKRLKSARETAGYVSAAAFVEANDIKESTYRSHENGTRPLTIGAAKQYAPLLGIGWQKLFFGEDLAVAAPQDPSMPASRKQDLRGRPITIREVDVNLGASPDGEVHPGATMQSAHERTVAEWQIPAPVIRIYTDTPAAELVIARVKGDSMKPEFMPGDRVLVDTLDRMPSPPGVFAIWDGFAQVIKRAELVPYSDPPRVRLISANAAYDTRELPLTDVVINGRVIGRWDRT